MATSETSWPAARPSIQQDVRQVLDKVLKAALAAVEPGQAVRNALSVDGDVLVAGERRYVLSDFRRVLVVGAGKASAPMAAAIEEVLGDRLPIEGTVTVRYGHGASTRHVRIRESGHPMPDQAGVDAAR